MASMTKKHFIALADELKDTMDVLKISEDILGSLCRFCRKQNPSFDEPRWLEYLRGECGPSGGRVKVRK